MGHSGGTLISVVVVSHDDAANLARAVKSVLAQTHRHLEVIVVDDHSSDSTPEVARRLCAEDPRVRFHRRERNSGAAGAPRNDGLALATGDYVMFLDSDDVFLPAACELLLREAEESGAELVCGLGVRVHIDGSSPDVPWYGWLYAQRRHVAGIQDFPELIQDTVSWNKLYRSSLLHRIGARFPEGIQFQDIPFTAQVFASAHGISVIPETVTHWHVYPAEQRKTVTAQRDSARSIRDRLAALQLAQPWYDRCGDAVRAEQDDKILKHHLQLYLLDVPHAPDDWVVDVLEQVRPLIASVDAAAFDRMRVMRRTLYAAAYSGDVAAVRRAAAGVHANAVSGRIHSDDERSFWSPGGAERRPDHDERALLLSELTGRPYLDAEPRRVRRWHLVTDCWVEGDRLVLRGESSDPYGLLAAGGGSQRIRLRNESSDARAFHEIELSPLSHGVEWRAALPLPRRLRGGPEETWRCTVLTVFDDGSKRIEALRFQLPEPLTLRSRTLLGRLLGESWRLVGSLGRPGTLTTRTRLLGRAFRRLTQRAII